MMTHFSSKLCRVTGTLALGSALVGGAGCQKIAAVERLPEKAGAAKQIDVSEEPADHPGEPDLSGTLYTLDEEAGALLSIDPSTGRSTPITTFANAGDYISRWGLVADPEARQVIVYRHDLDAPDIPAMTIVNGVTGESVRALDVPDPWFGMGRVEATGQLVGVALIEGEPDNPAWLQAVASIDPMTGERTMLAAQPTDYGLSDLAFDGVGTFYGYTAQAPLGHVAAYTLLDAATAKSAEHLVEGDPQGVVYDHASRCLMATTFPPVVRLICAHLDNGSISTLVTLDGDIDFTLSAVLDSSTHRYFTFVHDATTDGLAVMTVDIQTGRVARRPIDGPLPSKYGVVFLPGEQVFSSRPP